MTPFSFCLRRAVLANANLRAGSHPDAVFGRWRPKLWGFAYRMLGSCSRADRVAETIAQRWSGVCRSATMVNPRLWLMVAAVTQCQAETRAAKRRHELPLGPWLPEPLVGPLTPGAADVAGDDSMSFAFLIALHRLGPGERAAVLLQDVFGASSGEIATSLGKKPAVCQQMLKRARRRLIQPGRRSTMATHDRDRLTNGLFAALRSGDGNDFAALLTPDAELRCDGGVIPGSPRRFIKGRMPVARFLAGLLQKQPLPLYPVPRLVNGVPGLMIYAGGRMLGTLAFTPDARAGKIADIFLTRTPDRMSLGEAV